MKNISSVSGIVNSFAVGIVRMRTLKFFALLLLVFSTLNASAQSSAELKKKKAAITKEIETLRRNRAKIDRSKKASLAQINMLDRQIRLREDKINTINSEIRLLDEKISTNNNEVRHLQSDLKRLKNEYAKMVVFAHKNQSAYNKLMFVFAAKDFNQAYKRLKYIQQVGRVRKAQARTIVSTQDTLKKQIRQLDANKREKSTLLNDELSEKQHLGKDKEQQAKILNNLTKQEKTLQAQIAKKQKEASALNAAIQAAIRKEIAAEQRRARLAEEARRAKLAAEAKNKTAGKPANSSPAPKSTTKPASTSESGVLALSPEDAKLSSSFSGNRGRLQKPAQGVITQGFGHYKYKNNVTLFNPGINIKTAAGAPVQAVFEGQVSSVFSIMNTYVVMVRHGEYFTIYSKLKSASVSSGQKVSTRQTIGTVATDAAEGISEMQFQIWKGKAPVDPAAWVR